MAKKDDKKAAEKKHGKKAEKPVATATETHEHVPAEAENFEHTLKRLISERDEKRAANAGLYR